MSDARKYRKLENFSRHPGGLNAYLKGILDERFTEYRKLWDRATNREIVTGFPLFPIFETRSDCNYTCIMCHKAAPEIRKQVSYPEVLPMDVFERVIDECAEHGCPSISLNNSNEPLLDKLFIKRLQYANKRGIMDIMTNTNALMLDEDRAKAIIDGGLTRLLVSFDAATAETYARVRSEHFERVVRNVEHFLEIRDKAGAKLPVLRVSFVVININEAEQDAFLEFWRDRADQVTFQRYTPPADTEQFRSLYPESRKEMDFSCSQPFERAIIRGDGSVYPCCYQSITTSVGNIREKSLYEIWNSEEFNEYRRIVTQEDWDANPFCQNCSRIR